MHLRIGTRIACGFAAMLVLLGIMTGIAFYSLYEAERRLNELHNANSRLMIAMKMESEAAGILANLRGLVAFGDENYAQQVAAATIKINGMADELKKLVTEKDTKDQIDALQMEIKEYQEKFSGVLVPSVKDYYAAARAQREMSALGADAEQKRVRAITHAINFNSQASSVKRHILDLVEKDEKIVAETVEDASDNAAQAIKIAAGVGILSLLAGVALSMLLSRAVRRPLKKLAEGALLYSQGDLTRSIAVSTKDEIGEVGAAMNSMQEHIKNLVVNIRQNAEMLTRAAEQLQHNVDQSAESANAVASAIAEVAAGADHQSRTVETVIHGVTQNVSDIDAMAEKASGVTHDSDIAACTAADGELAASKAVRQMDQIEATVENSAAAVAKLGSMSREIGDIVETISDIAGQTNLLALNAAIEAARAGESGRGFSVVADEVRKLAEQSNEAAKRIAELIGGIQAETEKAVSVMATGTKEVRTGAEVVRAAGNSFQEINRLVANVSRQVRGISESFSSLATGSSQMLAVMEELKTIGQQAVCQTQNVSASTEEQSASMQEIAAAGRELANFSSELQQAVNKFKV